jgi:hypothetical protein
MTIKLRFLPPIPDGMRIMEADIDVVGVHYRKDSAMAFARRGQHSFELEREPGNPHDPNAIRVIGVSKGWFFWRKHFLGYVPMYTAGRIAQRGFWRRILPRLKSIYAGGDGEGYVNITFDILEPNTPKPAQEKPPEPGVTGSGSDS